VEAERSLQAANANIGVARAAFFSSRMVGEGCVIDLACHRTIRVVAPPVLGACAPQHCVPPDSALVR